jgi:lipopolysaccharide export system permease protein
MKWTVQRYVLREVVQTWVAVTGVLVAILVSNQLSRVLGQAADNQYGRRIVFELIALGAVMNLSVIVPVGLLLAVVLTLGRLYHDSEVAALQACGFAPSKMLPPLFAFAALIALGLA